MDLEKNLYKIVENMLTNSEERYRSIVEDQPDVIRRFLQDGTITFANDAYCSFFMRRKDLVIGDNLFHMVTKDVEDSIRQSLNQLTPENQVNLYERKVQLRDGEIRWVQWIDRAIFDEDNTLLEYQSTGRDITELKNIQQKLASRNSELASLNEIVNTLMQSADMPQVLTEALEKVVEVLELDGGWIYLISDREKPKTLEQIAQIGLVNVSRNQNMEIILEDDFDFSDNKKANQILSATVNAFQYGFFTNIMENPPVLINVTLEGRDKVLGVLGGFCIDKKITQKQEDILTIIARQISVTIENIQLGKKNSEIAILKEVDRIRSEFIGNISHEMKTPLGLITIMVTTLLREEVKLEPENRQLLLSDIYNEANNLNEIVDNLLSISSIQSRKDRLKKETCNLGKIVQHVIKGLSTQLSDFRILIDFPDKPFLLKMDQKQIEQVLQNLISNAAKYSSKGSSILILADQFEDNVVVKVKDEGIGIPSGESERIFDRFYRGKDDRIKQIPGVGLGLSICKEIIEAHDGKIWIEANPIKGSTFYFSLPL